MQYGSKAHQQAIQTVNQAEADAVKADFFKDSKDTTNARILALAKLGYDVRGLVADVGGMRTELAKTEAEKQAAVTQSSVANAPYGSQTQKEFVMQSLGIGKGLADRVSLHDSGNGYTHVSLNLSADGPLGYMQTFFNGGPFGDNPTKQYNVGPDGSYTSG